MRDRRLHVYDLDGQEYVINACRREHVSSLCLSTEGASILHRLGFCPRLLDVYYVTPGVQTCVAGAAVQQNVQCLCTAEWAQAHPEPPRVPTINYAALVGAPNVPAQIGSTHFSAGVPPVPGLPAFGMHYGTPVPSPRGAFPSHHLAGPGLTAASYYQGLRHPLQPPTPRGDIGQTTLATRPHPYQGGESTATPYSHVAPGSRPPPLVPPSVTQYASYLDVSPTLSTASGTPSIGAPPTLVSDTISTGPSEATPHYPSTAPTPGSRPLGAPNIEDMEHTLHPQRASGPSNGRSMFTFPMTSDKMMSTTASGVGPGSTGTYLNAPAGAMKKEGSLLSHLTGTGGAGDTEELDTSTSALYGEESYMPSDAGPMSSIRTDPNSPWSGLRHLGGIHGTTMADPALTFLWADMGRKLELSQRAIDAAWKRKLAEKQRHVDQVSSSGFL